MYLPDVFTDWVRSYNQLKMAWSGTERTIMDPLQPAFDAENEIMEMVMHERDRLSDDTLDSHIATIQSALESDVWNELNRHADEVHDKESRDGYATIKSGFETAREKAIEIRAPSIKPKRGR